MASHILALTDLIRRCYALLLSFFRGKGCNPQDSEDLTQDTLLRAWAKKDHYEEVGKGQSWLFAIAQNVWRNYIRDKYT